MKKQTLDRQPITTGYHALRDFQQSHTFWDNDLFKACKEGTLNKDDFRYIFSQYYLYCKNFTRYITAVMTNCENDLQRAHLSENLWEEAGEKEPEKRHAEIFREFLTKVLELDLSAIRYESFTQQFMNSYLNESRSPDIIYGSAFLSLGTEGIVAEMYKILIEGMVKAGLPDDKLLFFHLHVECDDEHALTLENMLCSYQHQPNWFETARKAVDTALTLRKDFFNNICKELYLKKINPIVHGILDRQSLAGKDGNLLYDEHLTPLYRNTEVENNIEFNVERIMLPSQVLDPRIVHIPCGKSNERHEHAHETFIYILRGQGIVYIDGKSFPVQTGNSLLVPRWSKHQTTNISPNEELVFLGVTDYNLTRNFPGNSEESYRKTYQVAEV